MLRITPQDSPKDAKRYYATADYYSEGQEIVGRWGGKAAERLGLDGIVDKQSFDLLCDNLNPNDGRKLTARTRSDRTVGYDFTWSVPKSVSVIYAMTGDNGILTAFRSAVDETMHDIESEMNTRVRKGGRDENRDTGNMLWAEFIHTTSRPVDGIPCPQLHAHYFAFNATWDSHEDMWKAGQFRALKRDAPYFQAVYRTRLANKLQDLGFGVVRKRDDFEIADVPQDVLKRFSKRTEVIEKKAREKGITNPDRKAELGAETREKKNSELSWAELVKIWDSWLSDGERDALAAVHRRDIPYARQMEGEVLAVDHAINHCYVREAVVPERTLLREALRRGVGAVTLEGVKAELARRDLIWGDHKGRWSATSPAMLNAENQVLEFARKGRGKFRPLADADRPLVRDWLNKGQKAVVSHVLDSRDQVTLVRGPAGSGKTKMEEELRDAFQEAGVPLAALAPSGEASRDVLRNEAGIADANTVARFLVDANWQQATRGGVVLCDEANMLSTHDMLDLFRIAGEINARVVLVGDTRQHRSVAAGEPLKLMEEKAGLKVAELTEIMRQKDKLEYLKAAKALSDGDTIGGFKQLSDLGWIKEVGDKDRYQAMAGAYLAATRERKKNGEFKTAITVTATHAEVAQITQEIRAALKAKPFGGGKKKKPYLRNERVLPVWIPAHLTTPQKEDVTEFEAGNMLQFHKPAPGHQAGTRMIVREAEKLPLAYAERFSVYRPGKLSLAVNDRIRITAKGKTKDGAHILDTGALFTVKGFTLQGDPIVDHGWVIAKDFGHISHGYSVTSQASEGKTVDKVFVGISSQSFPATNARGFYVPVTRGREEVQVFTDSKEELLRAVQRPDEPISATEFVEALSQRKRADVKAVNPLALVRKLASNPHKQEANVPEFRPLQTHQQELQYGS